jgi:hypothetical protein
MKQRLLPFLVMAIIVLMSGFSIAFFGEKHSGNGPTKGAAAEIAERKAKAAADKKGTCITEADLDKCKEEKDGTWTCYAYSANHKGSCD